MEIRHFRTQYGVGQGSFHAAHIELKSSSGEVASFDYVYDCGGLTAGKQSAATRRALAHYEPRPSQHGSAIDALILSHYDSDHINGAEHLANRHQVYRIYLPYLSPGLLLLELARCAVDANDATMAALYAGAFGGALWGGDVVRVRRGTRRTEPGSGPPEETTENTPRPPDAAEEPKTLNCVLGNGLPVPAQLDDTATVFIEGTGSAKFWALKFWNFSLDSEELQLIVATLLDGIGFPLAALERPNGAAEVLAWIDRKGNRGKVHLAYRLAIGEYSKATPAAARMPNLCSLALFSGPLEPDRESDYFVSPLPYTTRWYPLSNRRAWLGTGDALLGEKNIGDDFFHHFQNELPQVGTYLVPHHGAAPEGGPGFYDDRLNAQPGTLAVISAGAQNAYGHPRQAVLREILRNSGSLLIVTEHCWPGMLEYLALT